MPQDGSFILEIRDLYGTGSLRHVYRLQAALVMPDFALKLTTDRFVVAPGKTLDIPITVERSNGLTKEITVEVLGLPETVTYATLPAAKSKGSTLTLRLTAAEGAFSGPINIVGKCQNEGEMSHVAQATVADLGSLTADLWLTILEK